MNRTLVAVWTVACAAACAPGTALLAQSGDVRVTSVSPSGTNVPPGRQIVVQLDRPAVPIGRMQRGADEIAIAIEPALDCAWRWIDTSALACELGDGDAFAPATRYTVTIPVAPSSADRFRLAAGVRHAFETERPRVAFAQFATWRGPGTPVIRAVFNQPVSADSVAEHLYIRTDAEARTPVRVEADADDRELPRFVPVPGELRIVDFGEARTVESEDEALGRGAGEARRVWLVTPADPLAADTDARLVVEPGLASAGGPLPGDEDRVVVEFASFPEYRFVGVVCRDNAGNEIVITDASAGGACNPMRPVGLQFSAPTIATEVRDHVAVSPDLAGGRTDYDPWANAPAYSLLRVPHQRGRPYTVWLPERLQADARYRVSNAAGSDGPRDELGRPLAAPIDVEFRTDHRPPDFTIQHPFAVVEAGVDSDVPLYVTNLDDATLRYRRVTPSGLATGLAHSTALGGAEDVQYAVPFGVREMLDGRSGALYGRLETAPAAGKPDGQRTLFAQVTPFQVHVKLGHFNTLVWVTDLATGEPVRDAGVAVYVDRIAELGADVEPRARATTDRDGIALVAGAAGLDPNLELSRPYCGRTAPDRCPRLFVRVEHGGEIAILPLERRFEVDAYRVSDFSVFTASHPQLGHLHSWGTTAQGVYRAGDTIDYKLYVRNQSNTGYVAAPAGPYELEIVDPTGQVAHAVEPVELNEFGAFSGRFDVPETAPVGWYQFRLTAGFARQTRFPLRVLVTDFTPAPFRVSVALDGDRYVAGGDVGVEATAALFSGGAYRDADARISASVTARPFVSAHPVAAGFGFGAIQTQPTVQVVQRTGPLDGDGAIAARFPLPADLGEYQTFGTLRVEAAVRDERGRYVASTATADVLAVDRIVGLRNTDFTYAEDEPAAIESIVVDADGAPVAGHAVAVVVERLVTRAARVRGAGNAFLTQFVDEWIEIDRCDTVSMRAPGRCGFVPTEPGRYRATATVADTAGRTHRTELHAWVRGKGQVVWNSGQDDALDVVAEEGRYRVGDRARYLVQNPYPGARALITIERYGVIDQWVETFETSTPVVEFDVEPDYLPGFYLSILLMSPRVDAPLPALGELDLGKPAFKMAYLNVPVDDPYKRLDIDVWTDRDNYKPRETVSVEIRARPRNRDEREPIEVAVAVLDEAVLDLIQGGTGYFDPYAGFNRLDGLDVRNFGLLTRLVGRQAIERKGANPGGDGGTALAMRSLFRFVAYWNPSLTLDRRGRGTFELELPDNLTGWRVLVLGTTPTDRMGLGQKSFTVSLPTEIRPLAPNQVSEGDRFRAGASVMNRTDTARVVDVTIEAGGDVAERAVHTERLALEPFARGEVMLPLAAATLPPVRDGGSGEVTLTITARDAIDGDALAHAVPVLKRRMLETAATFGTLAGTASERQALAFPDTILGDAGEVGVELYPSVIGNVDGAFRAAREMRYLFWEQLLTKAVMASSYRRLAAYAAPDLAWPGSGTLTAEILRQAAGFQAPNGGMSFLIPDDAHVSPYLSAYTALAFAWLARDGHAVPAAVDDRLSGYLETLLRRDVVPDFYTRGMASTVRAVALAALALRGRVSTADLSRFREHVDYMSLFGKAHYILAAANVPDGGATAAEVGAAIMGTAVRSAGKLGFNERLDDGYTRILSTPMRAQCAVLSALLAAPDAIDGADAFALVRAITQGRGNRDHWENAQENVFCMNAIEDYARRFEATPPALEATAEIDGTPLGTTRFDDVRDPAAALFRPIAPADAGAQRTLGIETAGDGRLYYSARMSYAPAAPARGRVNAGIDVRREYSVERGGEWVLLEEPAVVTQGELVRVDLFVSLPVARHFVVVDDPVPGGLEPVNRDLANASVVDAEAGDFRAAGGSWWFRFTDWRHYAVSRWSFHHRELRHDAARLYADYLPPGNYLLSYTAQAVAAGTFARPAVAAREVYDPDVYGLGAPGSLTVTPR